MSTHALTKTLEQEDCHNLQLGNIYESKTDLMEITQWILKYSYTGFHVASN